VTTEQANKDFKRECVLLNDVPFIPDQDDPDRCHAFSFTMELLLERMVHNRSRVCDKCLYPSFIELTDVVMQRACRTSAGADSFFTIQKLLVIEGRGARLSHVFHRKQALVLSIITALYHHCSLSSLLIIITAL
jgi:hypothetical protein